MAKGFSIIGRGDARAPGPSSPEHAAEEFFTSRIISGVWAPKPAVERWLPDQRKRFEVELKRLEDERARQSADAVEQAAKRGGDAA